MLEPERALGRNPLFQVMLLFEQMGHDELSLPGLVVSGEPYSGEIARFDLTLGIRERLGAGGEPLGLEDLHPSSGSTRDSRSSAFSRSASEAA